MLLHSHPSLPSLSLPSKPPPAHSLSNSLSLSFPLPSTRSTSITSLSPFQQKLNFLSQSLHIDPHRALTLNPLLRTHPLPSLHFSLSLLLSIGLSPSSISRLFTYQPDLLTHDLSPPLHFLLSIFPLHSLPLTISRCPRLLSSPVDTQLSPALNFLRKLTVRVTPATSNLLVFNIESTLLPKLEFLQSIGFSYNEVNFIVRRFPRILTYSVERNLQPKVEFLRDDMGRNVRVEIKRFPQYFAFSLEGRIKWRYNMIKENKVEMGIEEMLRTSDGDFRQRVWDRRIGALHEIVRSNLNALLNHRSN